MITSISSGTLAYLSGGGWLMLPLAIISYGIWARYLFWRKTLKKALLNTEPCLNTLNNVDWQTSDFSSMPGALPRLIRHTLARTAAGLTLPEAYSQCRKIEMAFCSHRFSGMKALVAAAPLVGLFGTVYGMLTTFSGLASCQTIATEAVATGISQALITTQVGLAAALPGSFAIVHLQRLLRQLEHAITRGETIIRQINTRDQS